MDDLAHSVEEVKADQALLSHLPHNRKRSAFVIVPLDYFKKVAAKYLEHRDKVLSVGSMVQKAVQQLYAIAVFSRNILESLWVLFVVNFQGVEPLSSHPIGRALVKDFDLVKRSL